MPLLYDINYDPGQLCLSPLIVNMSTVVAFVWTEYGVAIAADGYKCEGGTYVVLSDCVQKIFPVPNRKIAYALSGIIGVTKADDELLFDFSAATPTALESLAQTKEPSLYHFAHSLATRIHKMFSDVTACFAGLKQSTTHIFLAGYYKGPEAVSIKLIRPPNDGEIQYEVSRIPLHLDVPLGYGSEHVFKRLQGYRDDHFAKYRPEISFGHTTIFRAVEIARNCVLAHYDPVAHMLDATTCAAIGGEIHIAQITEADGFSWAIPPKQEV